MPSWSIHLKIASELNKKLKVDRDKLLFGSLLPDTNKDCKLNRFDSHYYGEARFPECPDEHMIEMDRFLRDYEDKLSDPLILGYYIHLLTDHFYNRYIYLNKWIQDKNHNVVGIKKNDGTIIDISSDFRESLKYKHGDLNLYGKKLFEEGDVDVPDDCDDIIESIGLIKDKTISIKDVANKILYLNMGFFDFNIISDAEYEHGYDIFTAEELDILLIECIKYIEAELNRLNIIDDNKRIK